MQGVISIHVRHGDKARENGVNFTYAEYYEKALELHAVPSSTHMKHTETITSKVCCKILTLRHLEFLQKIVPTPSSLQATTKRLLKTQKKSTSAHAKKVTHISHIALSPRPHTYTHTHTHARTHSLFEWLGSTEVCLRLMRMPANSLWMDGIAHHGALMGAIRARTLPVERFPGREVLIIFVLCLCFHHALIWIDLMVIHTHSLCRL